MENYQPEVIRAEFNEFEWDYLQEIIHWAIGEAEPFSPELKSLKSLQERIEGMSPVYQSAL